jgi:hypothetical protein
VIPDQSQERDDGPVVPGTPIARFDRYRRHQRLERQRRGPYGEERNGHPFSIAEFGHLVIWSSGHFWTCQAISAAALGNDQITK